MSHKISLREFQESLVQRLSDARQGAQARSLLGVQAGNEFWLLELAEAGEIVAAPPLTTVPLTRPWFRGLANVRGNLQGVVDFSAFQGGEPIVPAGDARLLLVGNKLGINCALLVSQTLGLRNLDDLEPQTDGADKRPWAGERFTDNQGRIWTRLVVRNLIMQPQFLDIGIQ